MPDLPRPSQTSTGVTHLAPGVNTQRMSSGDQAALYIRRLIFDGQLRPGMRVPQDDIARTLGVSRIPIREALIALEREGWLTIELHRGAFINALNEQSVRDHYALYGLIYGFAAQQALARADTAELLETLDQLVKALPKTTDPGAFSQLAVRFHRAVVDAAGSNRVKVVIRAMSGLVPGDFFSLVPDAIPIERRGLPAIAKAIRLGDRDRTAKAYATMMQRVGETVVALFNERGLFAGPDDTPLEPTANGNGKSQPRTVKRTRAR